MSLAIKLTESAPFRALHHIRKAVLSPLFSGPLLLALLTVPEDVRQNLLKNVSLPANYDISTAKTVLQVLFGLGLVSYVNRVLNRSASNAWRLSPAPGWDWPSEIAVVTGGSSGIGQRITERLLSSRIKVAILDLQAPPKALLNNPNVRFFKCDVTSPQSVAEAGKGVRKELGHPTILVNNAGITKPVSIMDMPYDFLQKIFAVNSMSHWTLCQEFLPNMISNNKGHVVTVASIASFVALVKAADYSCTKASALAFHEALNGELRFVHNADKVLTTVVHPHFVRTPLVSEFTDRLEEAGVNLLTVDQIAEKVHKQILSRYGGQLIIPERTEVVSAIRGWPTWLQTSIRDTVGKISAKV